jgi:uncharacterized membrane protein YjjP (DUF1212 family)
VPGFFDPGHGFLSSVDERVVAAGAFVVATVVGLLAEYVRDAKGVSVVFAALGFVVALFVWAPDVFADEWHYALIVAIPVAVAVYLYRG